MLFGCDPEMGVVADTKFIKEFTNHVASRFDYRTGSVAFPQCLTEIESMKVKFESVTDNLGRKLSISRLDNKIKFKCLIVIEEENVSEGMQVAVNNFKELFEFNDCEVL